MLNKTMYITRLFQNTKANHISNAKIKQEKEREREREREKSDRITWSLFPSTPWKNLSV